MVEIIQNEIQRWVEQVWYSERPIYFPKWNYGKWLTYCYVTSNKTIPNNSDTAVNNNVTLVAIGKYKSNLRTPQFASHWLVRIPANWLYCIQYQASYWSNALAANYIFKYSIEDWWGKIRNRTKIWLIWTYTEEEYLTIVDSFTEWDELMPKLQQVSWWNLSAISKLYVFKMD